MVMWRLANGKSVEGLDTGTITPARGLIATSIWRGTLPAEVHHRVHWALPNAWTDTSGTTPTLEVDQMGNADTGIHTEPWEGQGIYAETVSEEVNEKWDSKERHIVPRNTKRSEGNKDDRIAMDSLTPGKWLTF